MATTTFSVGDSVRLIHAPKNALDEGTVLSSNSRLGMAKVLFPVSKVLWIESDKIAKVAD